jgi:hypothetical protein
MPIAVNRLLIRYLFSAFVLSTHDNLYSTYVQIKMLKFQNDSLLTVSSGIFDGNTAKFKITVELCKD